MVDCVRGTRTQPLICVGCSVHYWVSCAINKVDFFESEFSSSTHICLALRHDLPHFDPITHVVILVSAAFIVQSGLLRSDILRKAFIF